MSKTLKIPSLSIWIWVGILFILSQLVIILLHYSISNKISVENKKHYDDQIQYMMRAFEKDNNIHKVVIIGSSLVAHGVACSNESVDNIRLVKIWDNNDPIIKFLSQDLIGNIIKSKPNLVLFQKELVAINLDVKYNMINELTAINKLVFSYTFSDKNKRMYDSNYRCSPRQFNKPIKFDSLSHIPKIRQIKPQDEINYIFESIRLLEKHDIKTVIVDTPKPLHSKNLIYTSSFKANQKKALDIYIKNSDIEYWDYNGPHMYYKHCIDNAHLNEQGRSIYTNWLLKTIKHNL